jgi:hypothetical protein
MTTVIGGSAPSITFSDSTTQSTAFTGLNQSASPYTTSLGYQALNSNTGANNTVVGYQAGYSNTTGTYNNYLGYQAGYSNSTSTQNNAFGYYALQACTGGSNSAFGHGAGYLITTGSYNTILGAYSGNQGGLDIRTSSSYIVLSDGAGNPRGYFNSTGDWVVTVGDINCYGSYSNTTANAANLNVASDGYFRRSTSALKYKTNVRDLPTIDITKFRPVVYNSNCEGDDKTVDHFGFIADEVDQAGYKQLVSYGAQGEVEGFQYERMTAVLTQQVQQLLATVTAQATEIAALKAKVGI